MVSILGISCQESNATGVINSLKKLNAAPLVNEQVYLVIPNGGCDGCITNVEEFVYTSINKYPDLICIFTRITSKKRLKLNLPDSILTHKRVILDTTNVFFYPEIDKEIYPAVVYTNQGGLSKVEYQTPSTRGIHNLTKYYSQKSDN
ncbi:MAG: hypothetical protein H7Y07_02180 [Pyrinomonadaceae bacterium]|nr:hypothetical protein [Sphingobacteriaceae bacterium]